MGLTLAQIEFLDPDRRTVPIPIKFNPSELSINRGAHYAEVPVPGLHRPLHQFVRGETETLTVELFIDAETGASGAEVPRRESAPEANEVEAYLAALRSTVEIDPNTHAPPVVAFHWGSTYFVGIVATLQEKFTLFDDAGNVTRARATLTLKSYEPPPTASTNRSPDVTKAHVVQEGDRLDAIAAREYGDPRMWRTIAEANGVEHPRELVPGTVLDLPAVVGARGGMR